MNHTRTGKIARLPVEVREVLNDRLAAGEPAAALVNWLNGLLCVQKVLQEYFGSRLITEQNLSEWRAGGHQDWLRQEQARCLIEDLAQQDKDLDWASRGQALSDRFANRVMLELFQLAEVLVAAETDPLQRWDRLCQLNAQLARQRHHDHRAAQLQLAHQRFKFQVGRSNGEKHHLLETGVGHSRTSPSMSQFDVNCLESIAQDKEARTLRKYRQPFVPVLEPDPAAAPDPKSDPIQLNPTQSNPRTKKSAPGARLSQPQPVATPATSEHQPSSDHQSAPLSSISVNGGEGRGEEALIKNVPSTPQAITDCGPSDQISSQTPAPRLQTLATAFSSTPSLDPNFASKPLQTVANSTTTPTFSVNPCQPPAPGARLSQPQPVAIPATSDHQPSSDRQSDPLSSISVNLMSAIGEVVKA